MAERVAPCCFDALAAGLDEWAVGRVEGEFGDDDVAERVAGDVDALPETGGAEQHGVGLGLELLEDLARWAVAPLHEQVQACREQEWFECIGAGAESGQGGEEDECAAVGLGYVVGDACAELLDVVAVLAGGAGVGYGEVDDQPALGGIVEW